MYDILIKNCRIIDGSGAPWYRADVAVKGGKIVKIGHLCGQPGRQTDNRCRIKEDLICQEQQS